MLTTTSLAGCCGSRASGQPRPAPPVVKYLPVEAGPCLRIPPPNRPTLDADERTNVARALDHLYKLDLWARLYAWTLCGAKP